jgi:hypothetical protein
MRSLISLLFAVFVSACGAENLGAVMTDCGYNSKPFVQAWPCVRQGYASITRNDGDFIEYYISSGDLVAERIGKGELTEAEARQVMARVRGEIYTAWDQRHARRSYSPVIVQRVTPDMIVAY